jgi:hypothetical protein
MGYTHYFPHKKTGKKAWDKIVENCEKAYRACSVPVQYESDIPEEPFFTQVYIRFNGVGDDGHETFMLHKYGSDGFTFCKTDRKPYDILVVACLAIYHHFSPKTVDLGSDGYRHEWEDGVELARKATGLEIKNPIKEEQRRL